MTMEILSNFSSAYCFISFILGALFMLTMLCIAAMGKVQEPMDNVQEPINKVHFYVARDMDGKLFLYIGKPVRKSDEFLPGNDGKLVVPSRKFSQCGLNKNDYADLKWEDEPVEVFINMEN